MKKEIQSMLNEIVGIETSDIIFNNMFSKPIKGYKKGRILTVGELKMLPENSIIHLWYIDEDDNVRNNGFVEFSGYDGDDELCTTDGFTMPVFGLKDEDLLEDIDNSGWTFTVREAIK